MLTRINFNGRSISRTQVKNNILRVWDATPESDRYDWYTETHFYALNISELGGITFEQSCGIIAALSPLLSWPKNQEYAKLLILEACPANHLPTLKLSSTKAGLIFQQAQSKEDILLILNGKKTSAFFQNILNPQNIDNLTIDRHAISIAINKRLSHKETTLTPKQYQFFADCYQLTARKINQSPLLLQSATWITWRKMK